MALPDVDADLVLSVISGDTRVLALSLTDPADGIREPGGGYERRVVQPGDWRDGAVTKTFGPARDAWNIAWVALLLVTGEPMWWVPLDGVTTVEPGQVFTYEMRVAIKAA